MLLVDEDLPLNKEEYVDEEVGILQKGVSLCSHSILFENYKEYLIGHFVKN